MGYVVALAFVSPVSACVEYPGEFALVGMAVLLAQFNE
jgi:hypothetical protein